MNKPNLIKKTLLGLTSFAAALVITTGVAHATIPYNGDQTVASPVPAFNVFTGVPAPTGNEPDFLRARVPVNGNDSDATTQYSDPLNTSCVDGQKIQMRVYVHNGASADGNNNGTGPSVAHGTKVKVNLDNAVADTSFSPSATISANNAASVTDHVAINCNGKAVKLDFIKGSASAFSIGSGVVPVDENLLLSTGAPIQSEKVPGDVWGCWNERVYVVFSVKVEVPPTIITPIVCNLIKVTQEGRVVNLTNVDFTPKDAKINSLIVDFGDGSAAQTVKLSDLPLSHTYSKDGTFHLTVSLSTDQGKVTSDKCAQNFNFATTVSTPPTPKALVNTGAGDVFGIFSGTTVAGAFLHRKWSLRKFSKR